MSKKPWIKAIDTEYNGMLFRSRLEARWAVFFDAAKIKYEYEPEGFEHHGHRYLPDFYLPELDTYVEVKPDREGIEKEIIKAARLIYWGGPIKRLILLGNIPGPCYDGGLWYFPCLYYSTLEDNISSFPETGWMCFNDSLNGKCTLTAGDSEFIPPFYIHEEGIFAHDWENDPENPGHMRMKKPLYSPATDCQLGGGHTRDILKSGHTLDEAIEFQQDYLNKLTFSAYKAARCARFEFQRGKITGTHERR